MHASGVTSVLNVNKCREVQEVWFLTYNASRAGTFRQKGGLAGLTYFVMEKEASRLTAGYEKNRARKFAKLNSAPLSMF